MYAYVCSVRVCTCVSARLQGKREGWAFISLLPVLLEQIYRWSIVSSDLLPLSINELFQPVFIVRFSNLSSNVIFSYIVKDQGKGILIVPSGKKGKKYA